MKILLDTCVFLWIIQDSQELSDRARVLFQNPANEVYLSVVSAWEIAVKSGLGKLKLDKPAHQYVPHFRIAHQILSLPLEEPAALQLHRLPTLHRDPFDRLLVCQSIHHGMALLTSDSTIHQYPCRVEW